MLWSLRTCPFKWEDHHHTSPSPRSWRQTLPAERSPGKRGVHWCLKRYLQGLHTVQQVTINDLRFSIFSTVEPFAF